MKKNTLKITGNIIALAFGILLMIGCGVAHAQTNAVPDLTPYGGADTTGAVVAPFIQGFAGTHPWVLTLLAIMATVRVVAKPLFSAIEAGLGPDSAAEKKMLAAQSGPIYKGIAWLLDFLFSVKSHLLLKTP